MKTKTSSQPKRKYYRKCGVCGRKHEQSDMVRTDLSPNGWLCHDCYTAEYLEEEMNT